MTLTKGGALNFVWAFGTGAVDGGWVNHTPGQRGQADITLDACVATAVPTLVPTAVPTNTPGVPPTAVPTAVPTAAPAAPFTSSCGPFPIVTGNANIVINYEIGMANGVDVIQFNVAATTAGYGAIGFRAATTSGGMTGIDPIAFDATKISDRIISTGFAAPGADGSQDVTQVSLTNAGGVITVWNMNSIF